MYVWPSCSWVPNVSGRILILGSVFTVVGSHHLRLGGLTCASRWRTAFLQSDGNRFLGIWKWKEFGPVFWRISNLKSTGLVSRACISNLRIGLTNYTSWRQWATLNIDAMFGRVKMHSLSYCQPNHNSTKLKEFKDNYGKLFEWIEGYRKVSRLGPKCVLGLRGCLKTPAGSGEWQKKHYWVSFSHLQNWKIRCQLRLAICTYSYMMI